MGWRSAFGLSLILAALGCGGGDDDGGGGDADGAPREADSGASSADADDGAGPDGSAEMFDAAGDPSRIVFVTSTTHDGGLGGTDGADGICGDRAGEAGLEGTYLAWLSGATSAATRLAHFDGPYLRTDGVQVADDWDDLTDGSLDAAINRDEDGGSVADDVWTGTTSSGSADTRCDDFGDGTLGASGVCGSSTATGGGWTDNLVPTCNTALRLYCVQQ
jgi:hypothetical protein